MNLKNRFLASFEVFKNTNKFNNSFLKWIKNSGSSYDADGATYIEKGYNVNPIINAVISQMANKTSSVPITIKKIDNKDSYRKLKSLNKASRYDLKGSSYIKSFKLKNEAYSEDEIDLPFDRPNPLQTWAEFMELYKVFLKTNGNVYIYKFRPSEGLNSGKIVGLYLLPSHLIEIVIKDDVSMIGLESPIAGYKLTTYNINIPFEVDEITHIKYANPNFDLNGSQLYGFSPLRSLLKNIESSNLALDLNVKSMRNGTPYGFIHAKGQGNEFLDTHQKAIKSRLKEADSGNGKLEQIMAIGVDAGFTRIGLNPEELQLFNFLDFDQKQICNILGWSDKLLNNDGGAKYDNVNQYRKQVVTDNIIPDLELFAQAFNVEILPFIKGYENTCLEFDYNSMPEMQQDMVEMSKWLLPYKADGILTPNQVLKFSGLPVSDNPLMDMYTVKDDIMSLEDAILPKEGLDENTIRDNN